MSGTQCVCIQALFWMTVFLSSSVFSLKCYECGGDSVLKCEEFRPVEKFAVECPDSSKSCMNADREVNGKNTIVQRQCWSAETTECAFGQERVCPCLTDLCNCHDDPNNKEKCPEDPQAAQGSATEIKPGWIVALTAAAILYGYYV